MSSAITKSLPNPKGTDPFDQPLPETGANTAEEFASAMLDNAKQRMDIPKDKEPMLIEFYKSMWEERGDDDSDGGYPKGLMNRRHMGSEYDR